MYSLTRKRKKNATEIRSATACCLSVAPFWKRAATAAVMHETGRAIWGLGTGSESPMVLSMREKGRSSSRGSGNPANTRVCATRRMTNLPLFPEESSANPGAEGQEDFLLVVFGHVGQVRCLSPLGHVLQPGVPTVDSGFVIHCCIGNRSPRSVEITLESMADVGCASRQERFLSSSCESSLTFKVIPLRWASSSGQSNVGQAGRLGLGGRSTGKEVRDCCHGWCLGSF